MYTQIRRRSASAKFALVVALVALLFTGTQAHAQCSQLISNLQFPLGAALTNQGNLLVSETGTAAPNTGRISIVDTSGIRRTLVDGLPSGISDVGDPSGPAGLLIRGRTLYVAIGIGDAVRAGPIPGTTIPNPNPVSSPIFSSILAMRFSARTEKSTTGFTLTLPDQEALSGGRILTFSAAGGDELTIWMVAHFPNYIADPLPSFAGNVRHSNPFQLVAIGDDLYVTDGGRNLVWRIDPLTGSFSPLVAFSNIPNPLFPALGPPFSEPVPTGIAVSGNDLLVTLLSGVPFAPGTSAVEQVDPATGNHAPFITHLKMAIDVLPTRSGAATNYLVLQHASIGPFLGGPGLVLRFETPANSPSLVADCLTRPTSMTLDDKTGTLYVTERGGRVVAIPIP